MLKIDVIKFEAQDVITTSIPVPEGTCYCDENCSDTTYHDNMHKECTKCTFGASLEE